MKASFAILVVALFGGRGTFASIEADIYTCNLSTIKAEPCVAYSVIDGPYMRTCRSVAGRLNTAGMCGPFTNSCVRHAVCNKCT